jgi:hypothetical protein
VEAGRIEDLPSLAPVMLDWVASNVARRADGASTA